MPIYRSYLGKTGENCKEGKQYYIEYPIIRRNTNDREIYRDFLIKAKWKDFLNEVSEVCITNNNNYYHLLQWPS
jgi:hypothetical protein